ncbi:uncharacterized protein LOC132700493 [Cylas formicarius]|uniref:uncharacterized protein LOC132700493 n=1 Tax=Cylas formicarius TaxID=197179 RepID=UPI0029585284|nr:uncharacterized protein LOC132700493 [Cylas formicarius]
MVGPAKKAGRVPSEQNVKEISKKNPVKSKSPGRPKSPSRSKSPRKSKSKERVKNVDVAKSQKRTPVSPNRSKSNLTKNKEEPTTQSPKRNRQTGTSGRLTPTRRSPIRRSPTRAAKVMESTESRDAKVPFIRKKPIVVESDTDSDIAIDDNIEIKEKPRATVKGRTRIELHSQNILNDFIRDPSVESTSSSVIKRQTKSQNREVERVVHLTQFETVTRKLAEFSDEDDLLAESQRQSKSPDKRIRYNFGGTLGVLTLMLATPLCVGLIFASCDEVTCSFLKYSQKGSMFLKLSTYLEAISFLSYTGYFIFLALLSALPFGGKKVAGLPDKQGKVIYNMNGLFAAFIVVLNVIILELKNIKVTEFIANHLFQLFVSAFVVGLLVTFYGYLKSFYVPVSSLNPRIIGKSKVYNFFLGREMHPRVFGSIDLKVFFTRLTFIGMFLIDFAFFYKSIEWTQSFDNESFDFGIKSIKIKPTALFYFLIHSIFILDGLIFEPTWTSSEAQQEGFGYTFGVGYSIYPFMMGLVIKYIVEYNIELATWKLLLTGLVFSVGYILYRGSNNQRDAFVRNPYSPSFSHLESIPTSQGKKLLCSGFWGLVRYPNHLGNILVNASFIPFVLCVPPVVFLYTVILLLIYCSKRDDDYARNKYGCAWDRYCNRVNYLLVPKIY